MEINERQSSLQALLFVLKRRMIFIVAIALAVAAVFALVTIFLFDPVYSSTAKFYVNNTADQMRSVSQQDLSASKSIAESSIVIVKNSTQLLEKFIEMAGEDCSAAWLRSNITAGTSSGTEAFYISVSSTSRDQAYELANAFYSVIPEAIPEIINKGDVSQMDPPKYPIYKDSPSITANTKIGGILGFAIAFLVFFLMEALDNTIYTEEDVKDKFGYPIIGVIPTIITEQPQRAQGYGKKRGGAKK
ncbi:MAG: hypothetical protein IJ046_00355 [Clostridia bacterium]|nr:hypothetical protein [Clostridia bacterium]